MRSRQFAWMTIFVIGAVFSRLAVATDNPGSWKWWELSAQQLNELIEAESKTAGPSLLGPGPQSVKTLPADHPLSVRMQGWLDLLRTKLVQSNPEYAKIPAPKIRIYFDDAPNAFVNGATACANQEISFEDPGSKYINTELFVLGSDLASGTVRIGNTLRDKSACSKTSPLETLNQVLAEIQLNPNCHFSKRNRGLIGSKECIEPIGSEYYPTSYRSETIGYQTTVSVISITSSLLRMIQNEAQLVGVLYHEAGHYYEAHLATGTAVRYTYFYDESRYTGVSNPTADPSLTSSGFNALKLGSAQSYYKIPGAQLHPLMSLFMEKTKTKFLSRRGGIEKMCSGNGECLKKCGTFASDSKDIDLKSVVYVTARNSPPTASDIKSYLKLESEFLTCARSMQFRTEEARSFEDLNKFDSESAYKDLFGLGDASTSELRAWNTLYLVAKGAEQFFIQREASFREALNKHLGYYTVEQEADRFAVMALPLVGISPRDFADFSLEFLKLSEIKQLDKPVTVGTVRLKECAEYRANGWIADGKPVLIPVAEYEDPHHSSCYRTFAIDKVIRGNDLENFRATTPTLSAEQWTEFVQNTLRK